MDETLPLNYSTLQSIVRGAEDVLKHSGMFSSFSSTSAHLSRLSQRIELKTGLLMAVIWDDFRTASEEYQNRTSRGTFQANVKVHSEGYLIVRLPNQIDPVDSDWLLFRTALHSAAHWKRRSVAARCS